MRILILFFFLIVSSPGHAKPLKVGIILPLSGEHVSATEGIKNGIDLALSELSDHDRQLIDVIFEDDQFIPKNTVSIFNKLVLEDNIDLVVNASAPTGHAIGPLAERSGITFISISSDKKLTKDKNGIFIFAVRPEELVEKQVEELKKRDLKTLARITGTNEGRYYLNTIFNNISKDNINIVVDEDYTLDARDFRAFITKVRTNKKIDGVIVNLFFGQVGLFAKQAKELGLKIPLVGYEMMGDPKEHESSRGALQGHWHVSDYSGTEEFQRKYQKRYSEASTFCAGNGYELVHLFLAIAKKELKRADIPDFIRGLQGWNTVLGPISMGSDNRFVLPATVRVIH